MRAVRYSVQEALLSLRRARRSALMSIGTVAVAFITLGLFLLVAGNLQRVVDQWGTTAEMSVFLRDDIDVAAREALATDLSRAEAVERADYISKDQAVARFRADFPELAEMAEAGAANPFPASIELQLRTAAVTGGAADTLASELRARPGVLDVRYDREFLERLLAFVRGIRLGGLAIAALLALGAAFTVAAIVRLSLFARRDEVEIMRLIGAPFAYIRGPSVAEGTIIGGLGAVLALLALYLLYRTFNLRANDALEGLGIIGQLQFLGASEALLMVVAAVMLGGVTGLVVARAVR